MSVPLPSIDMSAFGVGQGSYVTLDQAKQAQPSSAAHSTEKAHLRVFNDSGSHMKVWMDTGDLNEYLPAGGWLTWDIDQTANEFHWTVINVLTNPPVNLMLITYYRQGEVVPEIPQLGNSPIGGAVQATGGGLGTADHLINVGNPASASPIINIQEAGSTGSQVFVDNQGNFYVSDYTASVLRTLLRVIANVSAGQSNVLLGNLGNNTEILGYLLADQDATFLRNVTLQNSNVSHVNTFESFSGGAQLSFVGNSNPAIDLHNHSGATHILTGAGMIQSVGGQNLILDTTDNTHIINLRNFGNAVLQVAASLITALQPIAPNAAAFATLNGSVSGTVTFFMPFQGSGFKFMYVFWNNYQDASNRSVALPVQLNNFQYYIQSDIGVAGNGGVQFLNNVTAQQMNVMITIGSTGGSGASVTTVYKYSVGSLNTATPVDHINILSNTAPHTASMQIIGV